MSSTYLPLLSSARPQTPSAQLRTSLLLLHPFLPPLSDPTRVRRVSPWRSWRRSCDLSTWMDPSFGSRMPPDDLSRSERRARLDEWPTACESVRGHSPTSRLVHAGNDVVGLGSSRPWTFSHSPPIGQIARNATRRGRLEGLSRSRERPPEPWIQAKAGNLRSLGKRPHLLEPLPPSRATDRAVGRSAYARPEGEPMPLLSSRQLRGRSPKGSFPPVGRRLGISQSIWLRCLSVHLIDRLPCNGTSLRRRRVVRRSPYSGKVLPAWGKGVKSCGFESWIEGPGLIEAFQARSTTQRHNDQVR